MRAYLIQRLLEIIPLLIVVSMLVFGLLHLMPGDPLYAMISELPSATPEDYLRLRRLYGLDDPIYIQYFKWAGQLLQGNPGFSIQNHLPVLEVVLPRLQNTLILTVSAMLVGKSIAILVGVYSAIKQYSPGDYLATAFAFFGYSVPGFWLGLLLIMTFSVQLGWLPTGGLSSARNLDVEGWDAVVVFARHLVLPMLTLVLSETTTTMRYTRTSLLEVIRQDYLTTARAKGLSERLVVTRHALRNALIPVVTVIALSTPRIVGGSVVVETVFSYPGVGRLLFDSIMNNDFPVAMTIILLLVAMVVVFNLVADVLYGWLDPRIRYTGRAVAG
jgi:peptide/nickel transport system permease protein